MNNHKYKSSAPTQNPDPGMAGLPVVEPSPKYKTYPIQLGMSVQDASNLLQKRLNELSGQGYRYCDSLQVNVSEAVLIFER